MQTHLTTPIPTQTAPRAASSARRVHAVVLGLGLALGLALGCGLLFGVPAAHADGDADSAECVFMEIEANNGKGGIDPRLKGLARKAKRPPLSSWKTLVLVNKTVKTVTKMKTVQLDLEKGGQVVATYGGHTQSKKGKSKWSMTLRMETAGGKEVANANYSGPSGDYLVVGYARPDDSGHLMAVQCTVN